MKYKQRKEKYYLMYGIINKEKNLMYGSKNTNKEKG